MDAIRGLRREEKEKKEGKKGKREREEEKDATPHLIRSLSHALRASVL